MNLCTAYNNGIGGKGKANYFVYRNDTSTTLTNMMSYYNTGKVSKTNAAGIKLASDKLVGNMTSSVYFNNSGTYYYITNTTAIASGEKKGSVVKPGDNDFITLNVAGMGTDFHKAWRNADGSPKPSGFAETASNSTFSGLGYKMSKGVSQKATPAVYTTGTLQPETTTAPETTQPSSEELSVTLAGDANLDNTVNIADAVLVMQVATNPDKYAQGKSDVSIKPQGEKNADVDGKAGLTNSDALMIQKFKLGLIKNF